jgi:hypothetical protein
MMQQVSGILVNAIGTGALEFILAVAAGRNADSECIGAGCR